MNTDTNTEGQMNFERLAMPALLAHWARAVDQMEQAMHKARSSHSGIGEEWERLAEEYPIDLAVRHEMALRIRVKPVTTETRHTLAELDEVFVQATEQVTDCVLGEQTAAERNWNPKREWYYWRALQEPVS